MNTGTPMIGLLSGYKKDWFRLDAIAGLTTATIVIPKLMAYAIVADINLSDSSQSLKFRITNSGYRKH